nr:hypothetical protein [Kibdelosporangium sp. MJ126-NF4]
MTRNAWICLAGQVVATIGIGLQWLNYPQALPPGLLYVAGAIAILLLERRSRWAPMGAVAMSGWIFLGGLSGGPLIKGLTSTKDIVLIGNWVMVAGLVVSVIAAVVAMATARPTEPNLERSTPVVVTSVGLLVFAIGNAMIFGLKLERPIAIVFIVMALLIPVVRHRFMIMISIVMSAAFLEGLLSQGGVARLGTPSEVVDFGATLLMLGGLTAALIAGIIAVLPRRAARLETSR